MKEYEVLVDGLKVKNTAIQIVYLLKDKSFLYSDSDLNNFIQGVQQNIWRLYNLSVHIDKDLPIEKQCEVLVEQLIKYELLPTK